MGFGSESRNADWDLDKGPSFGMMKVIERLCWVMMSDESFGKFNQWDEVTHPWAG